MPPKNKYNRQTSSLVSSESRIADESSTTRSDISMTNSRSRKTNKSKKRQIQSPKSPVVLPYFAKATTASQIKNEAIKKWSKLSKRKRGWYQRRVEKFRNKPIIKTRNDPSVARHTRQISLVQQASLMQQPSPIQHALSMRPTSSMQESSATELTDNRSSPSPTASLTHIILCKNHPCSQLPSFWKFTPDCVFVPAYTIKYRDRTSAIPLKRRKRPSSTHSLSSENSMSSTSISTLSGDSQSISSRSFVSSSTMDIEEMPGKSMETPSSKSPSYASFRSTISVGKSPRSTDSTIDDASSSSLLTHSPPVRDSENDESFLTSELLSSYGPSRRLPVPSRSTEFQDNNSTFSN